MKYLSKIVIICILILMVSTLILPGCDKLDESDTESSADEYAHARVVEEEITISIWLELHSNHILAGINDLNDVTAFRELQRRTGINVEWLSAIPSEAQKIFSSMMSSGNLPDVLFRNNKATSLIATGNIIPLNDLIRDYAPSYHSLVFENEANRKDSVDDNGNIWSISRFNTNPELTGLYIPFQIRRDWLKELDLPEPETAEDWYNTLKAFKDNEARLLSGKKLIPYSMSGMDPLLFFWSFGILDGLYQVDGQVKFGPVEPLYKEGLIFGRKLINEGLIDPDFLTQNKNYLHDKILEGVVGSTRGNQHIVSGEFRNKLQNQGEKYDMWVTSYIMAPDGERYGFAKDFIDKRAQRGAFITSKSKYPVEIIKWFDYQFTEEGSLLMTYGKEGETFDYINSKPQFRTDLLSDGDDGFSLAKRSMYTAAGDGAFEWACKLFEVYGNDGRWPSDVLIAMGTEELLNDSIKVRKEINTTRIIPNAISIAQEDIAKESEIAASVWEYHIDMRIKFLTGQVPLDNFDLYVEEMRHRGVEELIRIYQEALDRYNNR